MPLQAAFTINVNEIYSSLGNMYLNHRLYNNVEDSEELVDKAKEEAGDYGDTVLFYSTDLVKSFDYLTFKSNKNLLDEFPPKDPKVQGIVINKFRIIPLTLEDYLSKRAWGDEATYVQFMALMEGAIGKTKRVYDVLTYNQFIGTDEASAQNKTCTISAGATEEQEVKEVADFVTKLMKRITRVGRSFNEDGNITKFSKNSLKIVWNYDMLSKFKNVDLPSIFHKDGIENIFVGDDLDSEFFGVNITTTNYSTYSATTPTTGKPINSTTGAYTPGTNNANGTLRSAIVQDVTVGGTTYELLPGDELPSGAVVYANSKVAIPCYIEDATIMCKIYTKLPPYMAGLERSDAFYNPAHSVMQRYFKWGHNTIQHLKGHACVTVRKA